MSEKEMERKYYKLDKRVEVLEYKVASMEEKLDKISDNTSWILRIIIGAIVLALLGFLFQNPEIIDEPMTYAYEIMKG